MILFRLLSLLMVIVVSGCALDRAPGPVCTDVFEASFPLASLDVAEFEPGPARGGALAESQIKTALRSRIADSRVGSTVKVNVIALSAGGQYGAFGAGFLRGWSNRPEFDIVTGVSAGALLAPVAFAGPEFDGLLDRYDGLDRNDVLKLRNPLALMRTPSVARPTPLEAFVDTALSSKLIAALADGNAEGRRLMIGATNIDTGLAQIFDIGDAAHHAGATPCIREAMLASSAIPGLLPPRTISAELYSDGGLRRQVFFHALDQARREVAAETGVTIQVDAYMIINGSLKRPEQPVNDRLPSYVIRSVEILADEVLRNSILRAVGFAERRPNWNVRGILATLDPVPITLQGGSCGTLNSNAPPEVGGFDGCTTAALFVHGREAARAPVNWMTAEDLRRLVLRP